MKKLVVPLIAASVIAICAATVMMAFLAMSGVVDPDKYTEKVSCTVMGDTSQAAIGEVFIFRVDGTESIKLQKSRCVNMDNVTTGDTFTAIEVIDEEGVLQCIVKVAE